MANKTIFTIDGSSISNLFGKLISYLKDTRFKLINKVGKTSINIPLYLAIILGIIFPVLTIMLIIITLLMSYNITIEHNEKVENIMIE